MYIVLSTHTSVVRMYSAKWLLLRGNTTLYRPPLICSPIHRSMTSLCEKICAVVYNMYCKIFEALKLFGMAYKKTFRLSKHFVDQIFMEDC